MTTPTAVDSLRQQYTGATPNQCIYRPKGPKGTDYTARNVGRFMLLYYVGRLPDSFCRRCKSKPARLEVAIFHQTWPRCQEGRKKGRTARACARALRTEMPEPVWQGGNNVGPRFHASKRNLGAHGTPVAYSRGTQKPNISTFLGIGHGGSLPRLDYFCGMESGT